MNGNRYPFKRDAYYEIEKKIANSKIVFLVGPRKSGKTVCLKQLEDNCSNAIYYDLKGMNLDNKLDAIEKICEAIKTGEDTLFLIDEFTYAQYPDISLENIANAFSDNNESKSKIVITGSQSFALKNWANTSFCANAEFVDVNFITYSEWLDYKKISDISRESYYEYITSTKEFYGFTNVKSYLEATLHETIESNNNAANVIIGNDVSGLDAEMLLDVLYAAMFSRHDKISYANFVNKDKLLADIRFFFAKEYKIMKEEVVSKIERRISGRYNNLKNMTFEDYKKSLLFLTRCGLITLTLERDNLIGGRATREIEKGSFSSKKDINDNINITISYPMFYMEIIKDILQDKLPQELPQNFLGGIVECNVRGLLSENNCMEYRDLEGREIDYINTSQMIALEISVRNKKKEETHFEIVPEYTKILITKNEEGYRDDILRIPYYNFVYMLSIQKEKDLLIIQNSMRKNMLK